MPEWAGARGPSHIWPFDGPLRGHSPSDLTLSLGGPGQSLTTGGQGHLPCPRSGLEVLKVSQDPQSGSTQLRTPRGGEQQLRVLLSPLGPDARPSSVNAGF